MGKVFDVNFHKKQLNFSWEYYDDVKRDELIELAQKLKEACEIIKKITENEQLKRNLWDMLAHVHQLTQEEVWKSLSDRYSKD